MKIAFYALRDFDELAFVEKYSKEYGIDYVWTAEYPHEDNISLAEGCVAVSCTPYEFSEDYVRRLHEMGVKYMLCRSIGYDHLPLNYLKELGMRVSTTPYPTDCVAEYALMLMLMVCRKTQPIMLRSMVQDYTLKGKMGRNLGECTVGVVGTGHIGQLVVQYLASLGCKILAYDVYQNEEVKKHATYVSLDELYAEADVITLHVPALPSTIHMLNEEAFAKMKDGVAIINTARGALIDSDALIANLKSGKVGAAALDVIENESDLYYCNRMGEAIPNDELSILRSYPNVVLTPHTAFYVEATVDNMVKKNFIAVDAFEKGATNPFEIKL